MGQWLHGGYVPSSSWVFPIELLIDAQPKCETMSADKDDEDWLCKSKSSKCVRFRLMSAGVLNL